LGGTDYDFIVTSTLSSQTSPAVGRALGNSLAHHLNVPSIFPKDSISFVSVGDGSVNHAHFLSGVNMAEYTSYRGYRTPVLFGISDNGFSISLKGHGWLRNVFSKKFQMPVFDCDGTDIVQTWNVSKQAIDYVRQKQKPAALIFSNIPRRFGHAATDRQIAYMSQAEIDALAENNPIQKAIDQFVHEGLISYSEVLQIFDELKLKIENAFDSAVNEPKLTSRNDLLRRNYAKLADVPLNTNSAVYSRIQPTGKQNASTGNVMRKHMTKVYDELLAKNKEMVYIGEDVVHGGYYAVTEELAKKYPGRVQDFPPEETVLIGSGMGYSQCGLVPIVEIPYSKYLDCGADMFYEAIISNWLSNGNQPNGMIIRLQGFDKGVFGGNFHTHNILHIPPGLDVVCYSNGPDYARGIRYAYEQAKAGRVVMTVDSTNLLNLRHLHKDKDFLWQFPYSDESEVLPWDHIIQYGEGTSLAIVTYGNGVISALQAKHTLEQQFGPEINSLEGSGISVIDCPYLSHVPSVLESKLRSQFKRVIFADVCKLGQHPFAGFICDLQSRGSLPRDWLSISAQPTYNPLGNTLTFLSKDDIMQASARILGISLTQ
jgi:2-oxoisovalerate dehydrogenase E1 component